MGQLLHRMLRITSPQHVPFQKHRVESVGWILTLVQGKDTSVLKTGNTFFRPTLHAKHQIEGNQTAFSLHAGLRQINLSMCSDSRSISFSVEQSTSYQEVVEDMWYVPEALRYCHPTIVRVLGSTLSPF